MPAYEQLLDKIDKHQAVLGVIGLGYVGLPLAVTKAQAGYRVIGFDVDTDKVASLRQGRSYISDVSSEELGEQRGNGRLEVTSDFSRLAEVDAVSICVPTPIDGHKQPVMDYLLAASESIRMHMKQQGLVILSSTTYPGTTEEVVKPILEQSGERIGERLFLAYSPERIDPGNRSYQIKGIPRVVGGMTPQCTELAAKLYERVLREKLFQVDGPAVAEMAKIVENTFRLVNIGLMNELAVLCHRMNLDIWKVIEAASTKPYGFLPFYPGPGIGGHCIPVDPYYLTWKAKEYHYTTALIEKAAAINESMPEYVVFRMTMILNELGKPMKGSKVLLVGAAYKKNVSDLRESPVLEIIQWLDQYGVEWQFHDPHVTQIRRGNEVKNSVPLQEKSLSHYDLVVITTDHDQLDYDLLADQASALFDTRNCMDHRISKGHYYKL